MTSEEYIEAQKAVIEEIYSGVHAQIMIQIANEAMNMIKHRIQETGGDALGGRYRKYSSWYEKYKTAKGKYKGYTDFSFTNRMWTDIQVIKERCTQNMAIISTLDKGTQGSRTQIPVQTHTRKGKQIPASSRSVYEPSNYEKLEKNTESFGPILDLTKQETQDLKKDYNNELANIWHRHGL